MDGEYEEEDRQKLQTSPPPYLFERLAQLPGYTWETHLPPFHSVGNLVEVCRHVANLTSRHTTIGMFLGIASSSQSLL